MPKWEKKRWKLKVNIFILIDRIHDQDRIHDWYMINLKIIWRIIKTIIIKTLLPQRGYTLFAHVVTVPSRILQYLGHAQWWITGAQTFSISKLGGWKQTTAFHRRSNTIDCTDVIKIDWLFCNRGGRWTLRNWDDIGQSPGSRETTQANKSPKHKGDALLLSTWRQK